MKILGNMPSSWNVKWWARLLALLFLFALSVATCGVIRAWLLSGSLPFSFPGFMSAFLFSYIALTISWVGVTGKVPKFFPIGALKWPFFAHRS
ncbi:hypothetical protein LG200_04160 [Methylobacillus caricis]|uniref:hypothetical protein n=1 Tax=Methylobacillus caricis TaxID=1971611 RepID=UPI001CFFD0D1|nr:hypothetical protein [Methylobacillus caricis]MCB5187198.1 hypothetical protein [Methylobacillus caricis]